MGVARAGAGYLSRLLFEAPVVIERDVTEHVAGGSVFIVCALLSVAAWTVVVVRLFPRHYGRRDRGRGCRGRG
jgi:hypothetical protein